MEDGKTKTPSFAYAPDSTGFGAGTSPRTGQPFTRTCDYRACPAPCPYTTDVEVVTENDFSANCSSSFALNTTVPDKLYEIFQSGTSTSRNTLSGFFDIGWRQLTNQYNKTANNGDPVASGAFRHLESFSLQGGYRTVEGLVVDSKNGGVGFRNHTLPENHSKGATWSEDLLFLEPDSYCVDNNITIDFNMTTSDVGDTIVKNLVLVDHGGFVDMNTTNPAKDRHGEDNTPDLQTRAYIAAWTTNAVSMLTLNVSNPAGTPDKDTKAFSYIESKLEKEFELPLPSLRVDNERFQSLDILQNLGQYLGYGPGNAEGSKKFKNPWNITSDEFDTGSKHYHKCVIVQPG